VSLWLRSQVQALPRTMTDFVLALGRCNRTSLVHQFTRDAIYGTHGVTTYGGS
jgi:hypothetical protein